MHNRKLMVVNSCLEQLHGQSGFNINVSLSRSSRFDNVIRIEFVGKPISKLRINFKAVKANGRPQS
ncbi:MAG: hypothetical protein MR684_03045, partial [Clostridium sp.]|nr:hypothetical protein [Clostridium sp.]